MTTVITVPPSLDDHSFEQVLEQLAPLPPDAKILVVSERPGENEDVMAQAFVGRSGELLDKIMASIGLDTNRELLIANVVKCKAEIDRAPTAGEVLLQGKALPRGSLYKVARAGAKCVRCDWKFRLARGRAALRGNLREPFGIGCVRGREPCGARAMGARPARLHI